MESEELAALGLTPVRGLLLYGPPGTGKTLLARQIARALRARTPKIVSAPELLDRWVGGSEKLVRGLFAEAEAELAACNGDVTKSALHVIVIDEMDAVFRRRSSGEDSGEATRASVVNQILAKLDGINQIGNILLIGMTNRRELLDEALLRPGRLEVQIEVPLPDKHGRREILQIHFDALRRKGRLSKQLCEAIDGAFASSTIPSQSKRAQEGISTDGETRTKRKRDMFKQALSRAWSDASSLVRTPYDLAAHSNTGGFSGADIAGLVRCAGSLALARARRDGNGVDGLLITLEDVKQALREVQASTGR
jgi:vesicle-fusing ATPase